ncbi:MAG: hypothetical protein R3257_05960, partial [bacterium]|nr:hypothetical protein [bacterium]
TGATLPYFFGPATRLSEKMNRANAIGEGAYWTAAKNVLSPQPLAVTPQGFAPKELDTFQLIFSQALKEPESSSMSEPVPQEKTPARKGKSLSAAEVLAKHDGVLPVLLSGHKPVSLVKAEGVTTSLSRWRFVEVDGRDMILELVPAPEGKKYWDGRFAGKPGNRKRVRGPFGHTDYFEIGDILQILPAVAGGHDGAPLERALEIEPALLSKNPEQVEGAKNQLIEMAKDMTPEDRMALLALVLNRLNSVSWDRVHDFQPHAIFDILQETLPRVDPVDRPTLLGTLDPYLGHGDMKVSALAIGRVMEINSDWLHVEDLIRQLPLIKRALQSEQRGPEVFKDSFADRIPKDRMFNFLLAMDYRMMRSTLPQQGAAFVWISKIFPKLSRGDQKAYLRILLDRFHEEGGALTSLELLDRLSSHLRPEDLNGVIMEMADLSNSPNSDLRVLAISGLTVFYRALNQADQRSVLTYFAQTLFDADPFVAYETGESIRGLLNHLTQEQTLFLSRKIFSGMVEGIEDPSTLLATPGATGVFQRLYQKIPDPEKATFLQWMRSHSTEGVVPQADKLTQEILKTLESE